MHDPRATYVDRALTRAAQKIAAEKQIPFSRVIRVRATHRSDLWARRKGFVVFVHPNALEDADFKSLLLSAIQLAHSLDHQPTTAIGGSLDVLCDARVH